ncbi:MAG: hypothetical protein D6B25_12785 [Desulfobulbaceae bacterium]|nr:MAG: hypothetical protein D6B25_12785 [Desulfobulbaceae bacterium]
MQVIKWRESYETGIKSMDKQHHDLIELINDLFVSIRGKEQNPDAEKILERCFEYADKHLQEEERLLMEHGYPELQEQLDSHNEFKKKISDLKREFSSKPEVLLSESYTYLRKWWIDHIVGIDKKYGEFLQTKGVE